MWPAVLKATFHRFSFSLLPLSVCFSHPEHIVSLKCKLLDFSAPSWFFFSPLSNHCASNEV